MASPSTRDSIALNKLIPDLNKPTVGHREMLAWLIRRRYVAFANNEIMTDMIREGQGEDKSVVPITSSAAIVNGKTGPFFLIHTPRDSTPYCS